MVAGFPRNTEYRCGGSATSAAGTFAGPTGTFKVDPATGNFVPSDAFGAGTNDLYNFGPLNLFQRPDECYSFGAFGSYDLWSGAEFYANLMFTDYQSHAQIAPSGDFFSTNTINCANPLLSAQQLAAIGCTAALILANTPVALYIGRRNVEGGGRQDQRELWSYRTIGHPRFGLGRLGLRCLCAAFQDVAQPGLSE